MPTKTPRARRPSSKIKLFSRLTLAAFVAALLGPIARAQVVERAAPITMPAAGLSVLGAAASPLSAPSILTPAALFAAPVVDGAAIAAPSFSAAPRAAAAPAAAQAAPTTAASLRSMSAQSAALAAPGVAASDARVLAGIEFDAAAPARPAVETEDDGPVFQGPDGRTFRLVPGTRNVVTDEEGRYHQLVPSRNGGLTLVPLRAPAPALRPAPAAPREESGLTDELIQKLVGTLQIIDHSFVDKLTPEKWHELIDKGLDAVVKGLNEAHTVYYDKEGWAKNRQHSAGNMTGIGVTMDTSRESEIFKKAFEAEKAKAGVADADEDAQAKIAETIPNNVLPDGIRIKRVRKGSPAEAAGLKDGDVVIRVGGEEIAGRPFKDAMTKIQGAPGTEAKLTISRDGKIIEIAATRAELEVPLLTTRMAAPEIGYIYYSEFRTGSEGEFLAAVRALKAKGAKKIIIDLRGNPGGNLATANSILGGLLPDGSDIYTTRHRGEISSQGRAQGDGPFAGMEKIVLVDGRSASASELSATTLQDYGVTVIGPSKSYGKFSFQGVMPLPPGENPDQADAGLRITAGRFYSGKGRSFPGQPDPKTGRNIPGTGGVTPDVIVPMTKEQEQAVHAAIHERLYGEDPKPVSDPVLDKAIEILRGRP